MDVEDDVTQTSLQYQNDYWGIKVRLLMRLFYRNSQHSKASIQEGKSFTQTE